MICKNLSKIREAIGDKNVKLIAVSKGQSLEAIAEAYDCGLRDFGESYLQEALKKIQVLPQDIIWHYLGRIQSKKLKEIAQYFSYIHSLDSLDHAKKLDAICQEMGKKIEVFIQVNLDQEPQKGGVMPGVLPQLIAQLQSLQYLHVKGLMLIPKIASSAETLAKFQQLKALLEENKGTEGCLSMGMSQDYPLAIEAGATHIRVGEALFGKREAKKTRS